MTAAAKQEPLALLRAPFPPHQISKLPKPTKAQTAAVRENYKIGIRCTLCESWHHPDVVHLDYVGHAALTDRLLDTDPRWSWEPVAVGDDGLPAFDKTGGLWIRLTVCGVTRLGYGHANIKPNADAGSREKECIGDALRNAAIRFGAALDLWHKGSLHISDDGDDGAAQAQPMPAALPEMPDAEFSKLAALMKATGTSPGPIVKHYGVANVRQLNLDQYADALASLETKLAKLVKAETARTLAEELNDVI